MPAPLSGSAAGCARTGISTPKTGEVVREVDARSLWQKILEIRLQTGEPYLIFPTKRTGGGDNEVAIGRLLDIPAQDDSPPFFVMKKSRPNHVAEVLSVIVTPSRLEDITITDKALKLTDEQVASWEKSWGSGVGRMEMAMAGQSWTKEEKDARTRALTASAPPPQLLFYRPSVKPTEPMFVKLRLAYGR